MINLELTPKIKEWLDTAPEDRDIQAGAELLLRVNRNRILYNNIMRNPARHAATLEYQMKKILKQRLIDTTHEEVARMMVQVDSIATTHGLTREPRSEFQRGKRADHDQLPPEVQQLYVDNADIMRRMREAHTRLRMINSTNSTCPDSDRYPLAKDIIRMDLQYRDNWNLYDHYVKGTPLAATVREVDSRTASKNAVKTINLLIGKYAKNPSDAQADRIRNLFDRIDNPSAKLKAKMSELGLA
ncbi:MAG: hypothetical protein K2M56_00930 [Muribaculaceae bacterium]|nr:hypothetical protein [Muribaculaceae bacterium]